LLNANAEEAKLVIEETEEAWPLSIAEFTGLTGGMF
jgi:hypothetical protein